MWSISALLFCGCSVTVLFLFFIINMTLKTSFIVFDFWRWLVVHLWVEVTFEFLIPLGSFFSAAQVFHLILFTPVASKRTQIDEHVERRNRQASSGTSR